MLFPVFLFALSSKSVLIIYFLYLQIISTLTVAIKHEEVGAGGAEIRVQAGEGERIRAEGEKQ